MPYPTEAAWEAARKEAEIRKANEPKIDWLNSQIKHEWTQGLESLKWDREASRKLLPPNLSIHEHQDVEAAFSGGVTQRKELPRCEHGVYLPRYSIQVPELDFHEGVVLKWKSKYCHCCFPEWLFYWTYEELKRGFRFVRTRPLEQDEFRHHKDKLFDRSKVHPETFTLKIRLRNRTQKGSLSDLRLQEDPETGKPRWETMGGYVKKGLGYGKAGKGHGPDSEADDIRMSWLSALSDSIESSDSIASDSVAEEEGIEEEGTDEVDFYRAAEDRNGAGNWTATLPSVHPPCLNRQKPTLTLSVHTGARKLKAAAALLTDRVGPNWQPPRLGQPCSDLQLIVVPRHPDWYSFGGWRGITEENWEAYSFPVWRGGATVPEGLITGLGLKESEFFGDERTVIEKGDGKLWRRIGGDWTDRRLPAPSQKLTLDPYIAPSISRETEEKFRYYAATYRGYTSKEELRAREQPDFPAEDWHSPLEWVIRNGVGRARFTSPAIDHAFLSPVSPEYGRTTARRRAQWKRKAENQRGGGVHRLPLRRTPRWSDDWRTERKMRDTSANLNMYRWGVVNDDPTQEQLPDIPCGVAQRMGDGTTREIQVDSKETREREAERIDRDAVIMSRLSDPSVLSPSLILKMKGGYDRKSAMQTAEPQTCSKSPGLPLASATVAHADLHSSGKETMRTTAYEKYRQARLTLATNHGMAGFRRNAGPLEGAETGTALGNHGRCGWGGKAPKSVAGNYGHSLGEENRYGILGK